MALDLTRGETGTNNGSVIASELDLLDARRLKLYGGVVASAFFLSRLRGTVGEGNESLVERRRWYGGERWRKESLLSGGDDVSAPAEESE